MIYLDTGCLLKLYYPEPESAKVVELVSNKTIAFVALHELEVGNALELKLFRKEANARQVHATRAMIDDDVRGGILHRPSVAWDDVFRDATSLAIAHSRGLGCRALDILHCAAAQSLSATSFVTTDARQRRLALKIGLSCPSV